MEIVKTNDEIERLLESGLLKSVDEIPEMVTRAGKILKHVCGPRCYMRIGDKDGPKNF